MSPRLGAHVSAAGGLPKAVARAVLHGCDAFQVFTKNANQWKGRPLPPEDVAAFRSEVDKAGLAPAVSHASYLINLASAAPMLRQQSLAAMADELDRAEALGLLGVVLHPGCYTDGSVSHGLALIAAALAELLHARRGGHVMVLLEHTAGQGTALGATFEQLAAIIAGVDGHPRIGVCLDTCHLLASGYDIVSPEGYTETMHRFERAIGLDRLKAFHFNDSKRPLGSRVDRHTHIGEGFLGLEPFRRILADRRFADLPMLLETPKASATSGPRVAVDPLDVKNLRTHRTLMTAGGTG
jgi:deoxyribonuclease-4